MYDTGWIRKFYSTRAKLLRRSYIKKWGFTPEKAIMQYGKYIKITEM